MNSVCLTEPKCNIADAMKNRDPNSSLLQAIKSNTHAIPRKWIIMLEHIPYGHATLIPTIHVSRPKDLIPARSHPKHHLFSSSRAVLLRLSHANEPSFTSCHCTTAAIQQSSPAQRFFCYPKLGGAFYSHKERDQPS